MSSSDSQRTQAERITFAISIAVLVATFGAVIWANINSPESPPIIEAKANMAEIRQTEFGYHVPITIKNSGGLTAQDVTVSGELDSGNGKPETAEVTITFLAGQEEESAEFIFSTDPREGELTILPTSFLMP